MRFGSRAFERLLGGIHVLAGINSGLAGLSLELLSVGRTPAGVADARSSSFRLGLFFITSRL